MYWDVQFTLLDWVHRGWDSNKEFDALISQHLKDINAVIPVKNPVYDSTAKAPEPGKKPQKDKAPVDNKTSGGKNVRQQIEKASDAI